MLNLIGFERRRLRVISLISGRCVTLASCWRPVTEHHLAPDRDGGRPNPDVRSALSNLPVFVAATNRPSPAASGIITLGSVTEQTEDDLDRAVAELEGAVENLLEILPEQPEVQRSRGAARFIPVAILTLVVSAMKTLSLRPVSIGSCAHDSSSLRYEGHPDGLRICCTANPRHCWRPTGEAIS